MTFPMFDGFIVDELAAPAEPPMVHNLSVPGAAPAIDPAVSLPRPVQDPATELPRAPAVTPGDVKTTATPVTEAEKRDFAERGSTTRNVMGVLGALLGQDVFGGQIMRALRAGELQSRAGIPTDLAPPTPSAYDAFVGLGQDPSVGYRSPSQAKSLKDLGLKVAGSRKGTKTKPRGRGLLSTLPVAGGAPADLTLRLPFLSGAEDIFGNKR